MAIKKFKPITNGTRNMSTLVNEEITSSTPEKSLLRKAKSNAGRNNQGKITVRHRGGGVKRKYRVIDFKRNTVVITESKDGVYGLLLDPQRQTVTQIAGGDGGALTLHVDTKEVSWHLPRKGDGHITLTYTLLLGTQALSALHLALTLTKEEKDA